MINSIEFTGKGKNDYLNNREIIQVFKPGKTQEDFDRIKKERTRTIAYEECFDDIDKGYANDRARECLVGKKINFERDRINLIFGPNACGKSTILKAISGYAMCGSSLQNDGFTNPGKYEPGDYPFEWNMEKKISKAEYLVNDLIPKAMGNEAIIDWDGMPVYFHNFFGRTNYGSFEGMDDSILGSCMDAFSFELDKNKMSGGKQSLFIFSKLFDLINRKVTIEDCMKDIRKKIYKYNDIWSEAYTAQINYIESKIRNEHSNHITLLLDEIDKSLDINNVYVLFKELIPELHNINNDQIIIISHSPLVLSENVCDSSKYNIISLMPEYTEKVKNLFKTIKF